MAIVGPAAQAASKIGSGSGNAYEILGLNKNATAGDIRRAHRKGVLETHPDKHPANATDDERKALTARFDAIQAAYNKINTVAARETYDQGLLASPQATAQIQNPARPLAIKDTPRPAPEEKKAPIQPTLVASSQTSEKKPLEGPGKTHDEQVAWLWEQLGKYLAEQRSVKKQNQVNTWKEANKEPLIEMAKKYGAEKVANACNAALNKPHLNPYYYRNLSAALNRSLEREQKLEDKAADKQQRHDHHKESFMEKGLNNEQAEIATRFKMGQDGKGGSTHKHSDEDIINAVQASGGSTENIKDKDLEKSIEKAQKEAERRREELERLKREAELGGHAVSNTPRPTKKHA